MALRSIVHTQHGAGLLTELIERAMVAEFGERYTAHNPVSRNLLRNDVKEIMADDFDAFDDTNSVSVEEIVPQAVHLLYQRIGGASNLDAYAACLTPSSPFRRGRLD